MQFACDPIEAQAIAQAAHWLSERSEAASWLLADAALIDGKRLAAILKSLGWSAMNAFASSPLSAFGDQAPQLISLPRETTVVQQGFARLVAIDSSAPALSGLKSIAPATELQRLFAYLAQARVDGDFDVHCRVADTRVLPSLLRAISPVQERRIAAVIAGWQWFGRDGGIQRWSPSVGGAAGDQAADTMDRLNLTGKQFASMLDASEADGIFTLLLDKTPEVVPDRQRGQFHAQLRRHLATATALAVTQPPDRLQFVVLSLTCGEDFHRNAGLQSTWQAVRERSARLAELMESWSDDLWDSLQRTAGSAR
jgi:Domain of unknown function (DUF4123)